MLADSGGAGFGYAGNSRKDLELRPRAEEAVAVNALPGVLAEARERAGVCRVFRPRTGLPKTALGPASGYIAVLVLAL